MIWEHLEAGAEKIRSSAQNSRILQAFAEKPTAFRPIGDTRAAFHRAVMESMENARSTALLSRIRQTLLLLSLRCYGVFLLFFGAGAFLLPLLAGTARGIDFFSIGALLSGIPLCFSRQTLAEGVETSDLTSAFFFDYCGFSPVPAFGPAKKDPIIPASYAGIAAGALGALLGAQWILFGILFLIGLSIAFSVPEAILPPILFIFSFLGWIGHPSLLLGIFAAFSLLCRLPKICSGHRQDRFGKIDLLVLLFCFLLVADSLLSAAGRDGTGILLSVYFLAAWFALRPALVSKKWRDRILFCFLLSGSACSFVGILQYFLGKGEMRWLELARFGMLGGRVSATFTNPNFLAVYLLAVFGVSLGWVFRGEKSRRLGWVPLLLSFGCLIVTWTRGAWLGAVAAVCFFLLLYSSKSLAALLAFPFSLPGVLPLLPEGVRARLWSIGNLAETSSRYRLETWQSVLRLWKENLYGIGSGEMTFHLVYPLYAVSGTESVMHAHNVYLQVAVEHGTIGLLIFLALIFVLLRGFLGNYRGADMSDRALFLGMAAAFLGLLTMGFFDHLWYQPSLFYLFAMLAAGLSAFSLAAGEEHYET